MRYSYQVSGKTVELESDDDAIAVRFKEPARMSTRASVSRAAGLHAFANRYEVPEEPFTVVPVSPSAEPRDQRYSNAATKLNASKDVARISRVFKLGETRLVATNRILVGLSDTTSAAPLFKKHHCKVLWENGAEYVLELPEDHDPLEVANQLSDEASVKYAEPDFVSYGRHLARRGPFEGPVGPLDPDASRQYAPRITDAVNAWNIQRGDPSVVIAVLDEGVDTAHEDLAASIVGGFDGVDNDEFQEPKPWDAHGTACAGLAAAIHDNQRGIEGIAGGCSLQAIRIAFSPSQGADWVTSNSWIARSIDWAWQNGASILSNSWGGGAPSNAIINAFERARTQGRNGKGCVIVVAAGNASSPVSFPGYLPGVLTVSASNEYDEFKTKTSRDGESWWGSNYGPEVDVAAPGVHNWTTDISGAGGYESGAYTDFNGTSSATPIVAGACGLVLSANPDLTEEQVRHIIRDGADKVGDFPYIENRNDQFGFGRLNCRAAVQLALPPEAPYTALHRATQSVPVKDLATSQLSVEVGDRRPIKDIKIHVDIAHTWIGDLDVNLRPPAEASPEPILLHSRTGRDADDIKRVFDPETVAGLQVVRGKRPTGTWTLEVADNQERDEGVILSFAVELVF